MKPDDGTSLALVLIRLLFLLQDSAVATVAKATREEAPAKTVDDRPRQQVVAFDKIVAEQDFSSSRIREYRSHPYQRPWRRWRLLSSSSHTSSPTNNNQQGESTDSKDNNNSDDADDAPPRTILLAPLWQGYGTHYVEIKVGTPPQRQALFVDTSSSTTAFACHECHKVHNCGVPRYHLHAKFDQNNSSTFSKRTCTTDDDETSSSSTNNQKNQPEEEEEECWWGTCDSGECRLQSFYYSSDDMDWVAYESQDVCSLGSVHNGGHNKNNVDVHQKSKASPETDHSSDPKEEGSLTDTSLAFPLQFGCQTKLTGLFATQLADGIMGMSKGPGAFWRQALEAGVISNPAFSLCFAPPLQEQNYSYAVNPNHTQQAGFLTLGGTDANFHSTPMVYATTPTSTTSLPKTRTRPTRYDPSLYQVELRQLHLVGAGTAGADVTKSTKSHLVKSLVFGKLPNTTATDDKNTIVELQGPVVVDTGCTDTYLSKQIADWFQKAFEELAPPGIMYSNLGQSMTLEQVQALPTVVLQLVGDEKANQQVVEAQQGRVDHVPGLAGGPWILDPMHPYDVILILPPAHYMDYMKDRDVWTNRIYTNEHSKGGILGGNALLGRNVLFDVEHARMGWATANCNYAALLASSEVMASNHCDRDSGCRDASEAQGDSSNSLAMHGKMSESFPSFCPFNSKCQQGWVWGATLVLIVGTATAALWFQRHGVYAYMRISGDSLAETSSVGVVELELASGEFNTIVSQPDPLSADQAPLYQDEPNCLECS